MKTLIFILISISMSSYADVSSNKYNKLVNEYNELAGKTKKTVKKYNELVGKTKKIIKKYNERTSEIEKLITSHKRFCTNLGERTKTILDQIQDRNKMIYFQLHDIAELPKKSITNHIVEQLKYMRGDLSDISSTFNDMESDISIFKEECNTNYINPIEKDMSRYRRDFEESVAFYRSILKNNT